MITNPTLQDAEQKNGHDNVQPNDRSGLEGSTINRIATLPVELRGLAVSFTDMADQVQALVNELQERVVQRTNDLQAVADVSSRVATITSAEELLQSVTDLTKDAFGLYHAHIYLLEGDQLVLAAGAGEAGRTMRAQSHRIPLNRERSLVARAARIREGVVSNDVTEADDFLSNPLLPETRSELAVPMIVGDKLVGVLDVQSEQPGRFTDEDVRVQSILAVQIAIAIENVQALENVQRTAGELNRIYNMSVDLIGTASLVDGKFKTLNVAWENALGWTREELMSKPFIEFVHPDDRAITLAQVEEQLQQGLPTLTFANRYITRDGNYRALSWNATPLGEHVYFVTRDVTEQKAQEQALLEAKTETDILYRAAENLAQATTPKEQLEAIAEYAATLGASDCNLNYIDNDDSGNPEWAEITAVWPKENQNAPIGTRYYLPTLPFTKLWTANPDGPTMVGNIETGLEESDIVRELYLSSGLRATVILPLIVKGRWVAIVALNWTEPQNFSERQFRVFTSLASQLANAVDALRQFNRTARQANELRTVADVSAAAASNLNLDEMLQLVCDLTKERFHLYHAHVYLLDKEGETLILTAGAGEAGRVMKAQRHTIPMNRETSLVARAARTREGVVVNDVRQDPHFMSNPLLPETKSEMVVPMIVGDVLVGVLDVQADVTDRFTAEDIQIKTTLARQIAVAVENARAYEQAQARLKRLEASAQITELISSGNDLESTSEAILQVFLDVLDADSAVISNFDDATQTWHGFVGVGPGLSPEVVRNFVDEAPRYPHGLNVLETGRVVAIDNVAEYPNFPMDFVENLGIKSVVTLPLRVDGKVTAVIFINFVQAHHSFTSEEVKLLRALANQFSNGIQQLRTKAELEESEQRFREIATTLPGAIFQFTVRDGVWHVPYMSDGVERIFGISAQDFMADLSLFTARIHAEDLPGYLESVAHVLETLEPWTYEGRVIRPDGEIVWWSGMSTPNRTANGEIVFNGVLFDITERKQQEEAVRAIQAQLQSVLDNTTAIIYIKDKKGHYLRVNRAYERLLNKPNEQFVGKTDYELFPTEIADAFWQVDREVVDTGKVIELEEIALSDGMPRNYISVKFPLLDASGNIYAMCGISTDITERKRQEEMIREAKVETDILYLASGKLTQASTPQEQLEATLDYARSIGAASANLVYVDLDENGKPLWAEVAAAWERDGLNSNVPIGTRYYLPDLPFTEIWVANTETPTLISDTYAIEDYTARVSYQAMGLRSVAFMPMVTGGRWIGLVLFNWLEPRQFTDRDMRIFMQIGAQMATAVDAMRQFNRTAQQALELRTVADVSATAATELNLERLLQTVTDLTKERFNLYHAHVYLLDDTGEKLILTAGAGEAGRAMKQRGHAIPVSREHSLVAHAARTREGVVVNDVIHAQDFMPNPLLPDTKSELAVPMIVGDTLIGVLDVQASVTERFKEDDVQVQTILARQIAVAVQNARAYARAEAQAARERETAERLREVDKLKSQFLANMSHELRTPLNSIIGYAEVLLDGDDGELSSDAVEDITIIHNSGKHLLWIINDILDLAKIESGQMQMNFSDVDLGKFLDEIAQAGQVLLKEKPVTLELVAESENLHIQADPVRLRQIVFNLVSNAAKFTEKGSIIVKYGLQEDGLVHMSVQDTGIGIAHEDFEAVFQQFRQVDGSTTRRTGGTGLGLTITRHLVHMHGGTIWVESEPGVGSTFTFTIPLKQPAQV